MTYKPNIPLSTDKIRVSQGDLNTNFGQLDTVFDIDHVKYSDGTADKGKHKQVTIYNVSAPGAQTDPQSVLYSAAGTGSTNAQLHYRNEDQIFLVSGVRAFCQFTTRSTAGACTVNNQYNVSSVSATIPGTQTRYTITLNANTLGSDDAIVLPHMSDSFFGATTISTTIVSVISNVITIDATKLAGVPFSVVIMQA